jgi:hypothetical protein
MSLEVEENSQFCRVCFVKEETFIDILENQIIQMELLSVGNIEVNILIIDYPIISINSFLTGL